MKTGTFVRTPAPVRASEIPSYAGFTDHMHGANAQGEVRLSLPPNEWEVWKAAVEWCAKTAEARAHKLFWQSGNMPNVRAVKDVAELLRGQQDL